jgi:hypothetical protein
VLACHVHCVCWELCVSLESLLLHCSRRMKAVQHMHIICQQKQEALEPLYVIFAHVHYLAKWSPTTYTKACLTQHKVTPRIKVLRYHAIQTGCSPISCSVSWLCKSCTDSIRQLTLSLPLLAPMSAALPTSFPCSFS